MCMLTAAARARGGDRAAQAGAAQLPSARAPLYTPALPTLAPLLPDGPPPRRLPPPAALRCAGAERSGHRGRRPQERTRAARAAGDGRGGGTGERSGPAPGICRWGPALAAARCVPAGLPGLQFWEDVGGVQVCVCVWFAGRRARRRPAFGRHAAQVAALVSEASAASAAADQVANMRALADYEAAAAIGRAGEAGGRPRRRGLLADQPCMRPGLWLWLTCGSPGLLAAAGS
jgi:hypothetical protein